ncbi:MAG TPA: immunoglobulin-like domain-containing protein, partial [Acidobacteriota bacterium]|nr:immunoglobulin-like domain-containing protein [Acidobacteriota bacterium]
MSATLFFKDLRPIALAALLSLLVTAPLLADTQTRNADFNIVNNGAEWTTPSNAEGAPDDNCAGTSTPAGSWIQLSFPDFSLPGSATVTGIEVRVKYLSPSGSNSVRLTQSGAPLGQIKTLAAASGVSNCANTSFVSAGGDGDLWGTALTAAHFNLGRVGFRLTQDANTVDIDAVELTVHFTGGEENQPPVALCQNVSTAAGDLVCQANASASQVDNGSSDPDSDPISLLLTPSGPFALGDTAVTLTVSDDSNAQDSCSATVTVVDQTPPQIVLAGGDIDLSCGQPFMDPGASASDICDSSVAVQVGGDLVDTSQAGTYVLTYDAQDASGNDAVQMTRTVTVAGGGPPVVSCNAPDTITPPDAPVSWTASADGTCQGEVSAQVTGFDCFWVNPAGKRVDKTDSCVVTFEGDTLTVEDSGGVNNTIEWTVQAEGASGDVTEQTCSVQVVRPGKGKKLEDVDFSHLLDFAQFG